MKPVSEIMADYALLLSRTKPILQLMGRWHGDDCIGLELKDNRLTLTYSYSDYETGRCFEEAEVPIDVIGLSESDFAIWKRDREIQKAEENRQSTARYEAERIARERAQYEELKRKYDR